MTRKRDELLGHEADGIREFDNDLPRWWLYGFYVTIAISVLYLVNFHVLPAPLVGTASIAAEYEADVRVAAEAADARRAAAGPTAIAAALTDAASLEKGRAIFEGESNVCASCHRPDLGGLVGPDLTDDLWLHGCSVGEMMESIRTGYPTRGMLPYGTAAVLDDEQLLQVVSYILSKRGSAPESPKPPDPERDKACDPSVAPSGQ